jgi:GT2 family glycosyltransferase
MTKVSVIIVTWNSEEDIGACIDSIIMNAKESPELSVELIIVDNNSSDSTYEKLRKLNYSNLHIFRNDENLGYTKAVNQGIKNSSGDLFFLLNPDTVLRNNVITGLSEFLKNNDSYGACTPLLLNEDGSYQYSIRNFPSYWSMYSEFYLFAYIFPKSKLFGNWKMKYFDFTKDSDVNQPMAAALMIKKSVLDKTGIMDERFEMFFNDVDLCKRIINSGEKIRFLTAVKVLHKKGSSVYKDRIRMIKIWNKDCIRYFEKHNKNILLLLWLKFNLKISEIIRILYYKLFI